MHFNLRSILAVLCAAAWLLTPAAALGAPAAASADTAAFLYEERDDGTAEITGLAEGTGTVLQIPVEVDGHAVTAIAAGAFRGSSLEQLEIPGGVLQIGDDAFADCADLRYVFVPTSAATLGNGLFAGSALESFTLPAGIAEIPTQMFAGCASLTSVTVPASVRGVAKDAFTGCTALKTIYFAGTQAEYERIDVESGNDLFQSASVQAASTEPAGFLYNLVGSSVGDNLTVEIAGLADPAATGTLTIPETLDGYSVSKIGNNAFRNCSMTDVELPGSLTHVGESAFRSCSALQSVSFGDALVAIGESAFQGCGALESVALPDSLQQIGAYAFAACTDLSSAVLPNTADTPGEYAFAYSGLVSFRVPRGWNNIPAGTFEGCRNLASVTIPASVFSVGEQAFGGCGSLEHVYFLGSRVEVESIRVEDGNAPFESAEKTISNLVLSVEAGPDDDLYITGAAVSVFGLEAASVLPVLQAETSDSAVICAAGSAAEPAAGTDIVRTGMNARWTDSAGAEKTAQFVIMGDVAGSGQLNIVQLVSIARALTGLAELHGPYLAAADWDGNGSVDVADLMREAELFLSTAG
ncbi:MAG: leucine-rich repeat protein [Clostridia bacterium]|nr:leucine-rich repeat protein [Clostridia bacterium]